MTEQPIAVKILSFAVLLFSVIFHERAHAWSADKMGDPTGRLDNRLSWNPIHHIDLFMTIILPILTIITFGFPFGGAKPVQINPLNFRNPGKGMMISSAAGPLSNFLLAAIACASYFAIAKISPSFLIGTDDLGHPAPTLAWWLFVMTLFVNMMLGSFNLIPIPPLDGSRVLRYVLPQRQKEFLDRMESFGLLILIAFIWLGGVDVVLDPIKKLTLRILEALMSA